MTTTDVAALHQRLLTAFGTGDLDAAAACFTDDAVWHLPGTSPVVAGDHKGPGEITAFLGRAAEYSQGTFNLEPIAFGYSDDHIHAWQRITASRDGRSLDECEAIVFRVTDGLISEVWHRPEPGSLDAFFA